MAHRINQWNEVDKWSGGGQSVSRDKGITTEWVEEIEMEIDKSMSDTQDCITGLHQLCGLLFDLNTKKNEKEEAAIKKDDVWHWWWEPKVNFKIIRCIQELKPPSTHSILSDKTLGTKTYNDLSFMLNDMVKSDSYSKAMKLAFKFLQMGLKNFDNALQERTEEYTNVQTELKECHTNLDNAKMELETTKGKVSLLVADNARLKEENFADSRGKPTSHACSQGL